MKYLNLILLGIIFALASALIVTVSEFNKTSSIQESQENDKQQIEKLIATFKEKYSEQGVTEVPDSKGVPYKYSSKTTYSDVELIIERDRIVLRSWNDEGVMCMVSNPIPRDIQDNCPFKW